MPNFRDLLASARAALLLGLSLSLVAPVALAADYEARLGWAMWQQDFAGNFDSNDALALRSIDIAGDLNFDSEAGNQFYLVLEHPIGVVPNVRVQHTTLETEGENVLAENIRFDGVNFIVDSDIVSSLDLNHLDLTFYWHPIYDTFSVALGFTLRMIDGSVKIASRDGLRRSDQLFNEVAPLPYVQLSYDIPRTGVSVYGEANVIAYSGDRFLDYRLGGSWSGRSGFSVEAGYRVMDLRVDDLEVTDNQGDAIIDADVEIDGFFLGAFWRF